MTGATVCRVHGGAAPQVREAAARRLAVAELQDRADRALTDEGFTAGTADPLRVLDAVLTEAEELKTRLGRVVHTLEDDTLRYRGRAGEQIRGELQMYVAMLDKVARIATHVVKLDLAERRVRVQEVQVTALLTAMRNALHAVDAPVSDPELKNALVLELRRAGAEIA